MQNKKYNKGQKQTIVLQHSFLDELALQLEHKKLVRRVQEAALQAF